MPETHDRAIIQDLVAADIEDRKQFGINKYGQALQSGNGRDMVRDAYEDAMDLAIYLRGVIDGDHHIELELQQVRSDRSALINWAQKTAAPMQWAATGTASSAIHNLGAYVSVLEEIVKAVEEDIGGSCQSHAEPEKSCTTCGVLSMLKVIR